jgi:hypothetical protein
MYVNNVSLIDSFSFFLNELFLFSGGVCAVDLEIMRSIIIDSVVYLAESAIHIHNTLSTKQNKFLMMKMNIVRLN